MEELLDDVEGYIDDWFQAKLPFAFQGRIRWTPPTDVYETEEAIHVVLAIPGLDTDDCKVEFESDTLTIQGVRRETAGGKRHYHKMELPVGPFRRRIRIVRPIDSESVRVRYEDGLLRVRLPKAERGSREIPID
ncbi:MAG: Hsp20/alpha crystallin family protein [Gemmatimonadota bacterium]|nr:Hsp20/alpha crystallin family protein [Gemmatimonadota bacterium]